LELFAEIALFWHFYFTRPYSASQKSAFFTFFGLFESFFRIPMQSLSDSQNPENPKKHCFSTFLRPFLSFFKRPMPPLSNSQSFEKDLKKEFQKHEKHGFSLNLARISLFSQKIGLF